MKTLHGEIMREAAVCGRMKPRAMPTPEPWKASAARKSSNFGNHVAHVHAGTTTIAKVMGGAQDDRDVAEANARLIAAAPELHEIALHLIGLAPTEVVKIDALQARATAILAKLPAKQR